MTWSIFDLFSQQYCYNPPWNIFDRSAWRCSCRPCHPHHDFATACGVCKVGSATANLAVCRRYLEQKILAKFCQLPAKEAP